MARQRVAMRDHSAESRLFNRRSLVAIIGTFALICVLLGNLYYLQFEQHETYTTRSNDNRIKVLPIAPPRGLVYDRNGVLLAENRPNFSLEIIPENVDDLDQMIAELSELLELSETDVERFQQNRKHTRRFKPVVLKSQLTEQQVAMFSVQQHKFHGASIDASLIRFYPYGDSLTHLLGYVARINAKDLERLEKENKLAEYDATRTIGKQGIERYYEEILHGSVGYQEVEVNNRGRVIRTMKIVPPIPGKDLYLNVDIRLQLEAQRLLAGRRGSAVLLDAKTSGVLAMVSSPSYDPNLFVNGISSKNYNKLLNSTDRPLINRATKGVYPPASTVKPQLAVMGLELGKITVEQRMWDPGWFQIPNTKRRFRDWKRWGHGWVDVYKAIEQSVDTYFYKLAYETGIDEMHAYMSKFGFGKYTGIDIHEESRANMPSREWKRARYRQPWWQGDTISVGIGQGYWTTTPIQLAQATNILVNKGKIITPRILKSVGDANSHIGLPPQVQAPIALNSDKNWQVALDGMYGVINKSNGTARKAFEDTAYVAAGKSGTAQIVSIAEDAEYDAESLKEQHRDNAMFVAYAPFETPEIVASVVVENAGGGSSNAAPVIRELFDSYFETKDTF
ncbi:penicillin-binding protein 2 [Agarivorans aestuarii]|uniref:Peptidoglycan D,D-transpeptidase MrdA n=1 Tax=Agarivorans aestuarii TaxID=1563703 RepID=A0ABU7FZN5_9ALTE|nr:penicillin-binding protein 2 [Agarivorans aestuarii]MEE1672633.1 penicillin-binding protein 2 [Agarivorans aestuarii]